MGMAMAMAIAMAMASVLVGLRIRKISLPKFGKALAVAMTMVMALVMAMVTAMGSEAKSKGGEPALFTARPGDRRGRIGRPHISYGE